MCIDQDELSRAIADCAVVYDGNGEQQAGSSDLRDTAGEDDCDPRGGLQPLIKPTTVDSSKYTVLPDF